MQADKHTLKTEKKKGRSPSFCLRSTYSAAEAEILLHAVDEALYSGNRLVHHLLLFCVQFELENLLYTLLAKNCRNADIVAVYTELTLEEAAGGENTLLIFEDRFCHSDC